MLSLTWPTCSDMAGEVMQKVCCAALPTCADTLNEVTFVDMLAHSLLQTSS